MSENASTSRAGVRRLRVLLLVSQPVQYGAHLYRRYADIVDLTVAYCSPGAAEGWYDADFGTDVRWDRDLLTGYRSVVMHNIGRATSRGGFFDAVNPAVWSLVGGEFDVVVIYGHRSVTFLAGLLRARLAGVGVLLSTDAVTANDRRGRTFKSRVKRLVLPRLYRRASGTLAPSTRTLRFLLESGLSEDRVFLVPYVVDNDWFTSGSADGAAELRARLKIDQEMVILFCGKLVAWKRPADLVHAAVLVPEAHVVFAGDGPLRSELERLAVDNGVRERVHFLGFVNQGELPNVYRFADVLVLPSEFEPFGLVVNEAFAAGRPAIVASACGCADDLIIEGRTGWTYTAGDVDQLAERLRSMLDVQTRQRMGRNAKDRIEEWGPDANVVAFIAAATAASRRGRRRRRQPS